MTAGDDIKITLSDAEIKALNKLRLNRQSPSRERVLYVYKRFSKTIPENDPIPEEKKVSAIVEALSQADTNTSEIFFVDEAHFSNQSYVRRGWFKKGEKKVGTIKNKLSKTLFGALTLKTNKFYWKQTDAGNSRTFIQFLHQLHQAYPQKN